MFDNPRNVPPNGVAPAPNAGINANKPKPEVFAPKQPVAEPEDMYAGINTGGVTAPPRVMPQIQPDYNRGSGFKKILVVVLALVIIGGAAYAGYFIYGKYFNVNVNEANENTNIANENENENENLNVANENENLNVGTDYTNLNTGTDYTNLNLNQPVALDSDNDGLTDEQEISLGTDPLKTDTDDDGLFDREEVYIYNTNPNNPDTDGDTYLDGAEVKNNYNPKGPGRLSEIPGQGDYTNP